MPRFIPIEADQIRPEDRVVELGEMQTIDAGDIRPEDRVVDIGEMREGAIDIPPTTPREGEFRPEIQVEGIEAINPGAERPDISQGLATEEDFDAIRNWHLPMQHMSGENIRYVRYFTERAERGLLTKKDVSTFMERFGGKSWLEAEAQEFNRDPLKKIWADTTLFVEELIPTLSESTLAGLAETGAGLAQTIARIKAGKLFDLEDLTDEELGVFKEGVEYALTISETLRGAREQQLLELFAADRAEAAIAIGAQHVAGDVAFSLIKLKAGLLFTNRIVKMVGAGAKAIPVIKKLRLAAGIKKLGLDTLTSSRSGQAVAKAIIGAMINYATTPGNQKDKTQSAMLTFLYMHTPAWSGKMPTHVSAILVDFVLNSAISAGYNPADPQNPFKELLRTDPKTGKLTWSGQYRAAHQRANDTADALGLAKDDPDRLKLTLLYILPIVGSDAGFALLTRSAKAQMRAMKGDGDVVKTMAEMNRFEGVRQHAENALSRFVDGLKERHGENYWSRWTNDEQIHYQALQRAVADPATAAQKAYPAKIPQTPKTELTKLDTGAKEEREEPVTKPAVPWYKYKPVDLLDYLPKGEIGGQFAKGVPIDAAALAVNPYIRNNINRVKRQIYDNTGLHLTVTHAIRTEGHEKALMATGLHEVEEGGAHRYGDALDIVFRNNFGETVDWRTMDNATKAIIKEFVEPVFKVQEYLTSESSKGSAHIHIAVPDKHRSTTLVDDVIAGLPSDAFSRLGNVRDASELRELLARYGEKPETWPTVQKFYWSKVADGSIPKPETSPTKDDIITALTKRTPQILAAKETPTYMRSILPKAVGSRSSVEYLRQNADHVKSVIRKSVLAKPAKGERAVLAGRAKRLIDGIDAGLDALDKVDFRVDLFDSVIDNMVKGRTANVQGMTRKQLMARLHSLLAVKDKTGKRLQAKTHDAVRDYVRQRLGMPEEGFSLTQVDAEGLRRAVLTIPVDKVKNFGPESGEILKIMWRAETGDDALHTINMDRASRGKPLITDVEADILAGVKPPSARKPFELSGDDRMAIVAQSTGKLANTVGGRASLDRIMDSLSQPLPEEPMARRQFIKDVHRVALQGMRADKAFGTEASDDPSATKQSLNDRFTRLARRMLSFGPARYAVADIAADNGSTTLQRNYIDYVKGTRRGEYESHRRGTSVFREEGMSRFLMGRMSGDDRANEAVIRLVGDNPDNPSDPAAYAKVLKYMSDLKETKPKYHDQLQRVIKHFKTEFSGDPEHDVLGPSATNLRFLQLVKWGRVWDVHGEAIVRAETRGKTDTEAHALLEKHTPFIYDEASGTGARVDRTVMQTLWRIYKNRGKEAAMAAAARGKYGGRKYYYMTMGERTNDGVLLPLESKLMPEYKESERMARLNITGVVNPRQGIFAYKQGSFISNALWHMRTLEVQARTIEAADSFLREVKQYKDDGRVPDWVARGLEEGVKSSWGIRNRREPAGQLVTGLNRLFWLSYPLALTRLAWYSARNMSFQGMPTGPISTMTNPAELAIAYKSMVAPPKNSLWKKALKETFMPEVSEKQSIFYERFMLQDPGEFRYPGIFKRLMVGRQALADFGCLSMSASDTGNRFMVWSPAYLIAERGVNQILAGQSDRATVVKSMRLDVLHPTQRVELGELLTRAERNPGGPNRLAYEPFARRYPDIINENINFLYRTPERTPVEAASPNTRFVIGLANYPINNVIRFYRNGVEPIAREARAFLAGEKMDPSAVTHGMQVLLGGVVAHTFTSIVAAHIIGEKRDYDEIGGRESQPTYGVGSMLWGMWGPGGELGALITEKARHMILAITCGDVNMIEENADWLWEKASWFGPIVSDLGNAYEAVGNYDGVSNVLALKMIYVKALRKLGVDISTPQEFDSVVWTDRNVAESIVHLFFGTEKTRQTVIEQLRRDNVVLRKITDKFMKEQQLRQQARD